MSSAPRKAATQRGQVSRETIVDAALEVLRSEGLGRLTMRRLAEQVGVEAMSLYNHVRDKRDLLDAVASRPLSGLAAPSPELPWTARLETLFYSLYDILSANPWLVTVLTVEQIEPSGPAVVGAIEAAIGVLEEAGLTPAERVSAFRGLLALCIGLVTTHTLGLSASPAEALARFAQADPTQWRDAGVPRMAALAPQFLITKPADDVRFMLGAYLAAIGHARSRSPSPAPPAGSATPSA